MDKLKELKQILKDQEQRYFMILGRNGICKESNRVALQIEQSKRVIASFIALSK
jgi:hypothetical protein